VLSADAVVAELLLSILLKVVSKSKTYAQGFPWVN